MANAQSTVSLSGEAQMAPIPNSLLPGVFESDLSAEVYLESSNMILTQNVSVDATSYGTYNLFSQLTPGAIAAGTLVSDVMVQADPVQKTGTEFIGSLTFSSDILGVIVKSAMLTASDAIFGVSGVSYPGADGARGLELNGQDDFSISQDMHTLTFDLGTYTNIDEIRIITAGVTNTTANSGQEAVPEPGTVSLLALGFGGICLACFRAAGRRSARA